MSRSRKKAPWIVDKKSKLAKRQANKRVRRTKNIANGKSFKKVYESWDICDYKWRFTKEEIEGNQDLYYPLYRYWIK